MNNCLISAKIGHLMLILAIMQSCEVSAAPQDTSQDSAWHNNQILALVNCRPADGWRVSPSGLRFRRIAGGGTGKRPSSVDTVAIHYTGKLVDGTVFDSSTEASVPPMFPLSRLIKGWQEGVPLMSVGDTFEFVIPQELAYGPKGKGPIPGGATLLFTIELISIRESN
jgi:FKBP-type peptidyl-prolyl cis-trans isomerase FkpA